MKFNFFLKKYIVTIIYVFILTLCNIYLFNHVHFFANLLLFFSTTIIAFYGSRFSKILYLLLFFFIYFINFYCINKFNCDFNELGAQAIVSLRITCDSELKTTLEILNIFDYINIAIFIILFATALFVPPKHSKKSNLLSCLSLLCVVIVVVHTYYKPVYNALIDYKDRVSYGKQRNAFKFHSVDNRQFAKAVYVLVIGESIRKDTFDEFLTPEIVPTLSKAKKDNRLFGLDDMISYYQQTYFSVFTLLSRRPPIDNRAFFREKGLLSLFKEAGFKTYYFSYLQNPKSDLGFNGVMSEADIYRCTLTQTEKDFDYGMINDIKKTINANQGKILIVIKTIGAHFLYHTRYPDKEIYKIYKPCYTKNNFSMFRISDKEKLINTYKNTVHFSMGFIDKIAEIIENNDCPGIFAFVGDHGVINYDDGRKPLFGSAKSNYHIPCVFLINKIVKPNIPIYIIDNLGKNKKLAVGNDYFFDTFASLCGIDYPDKRVDKDLTSSFAKPLLKRQVFLFDNLVNYNNLL